MKAHTRIAILVFVSCTLATAGDSKPCSSADAKVAEETADLIHSWADFQTAFRKYGHCDDGAISEGYSDVAMRMMAQRWTDIAVLAKLGSTDPQFLKFVLSHIDETWTDVDFRAVMKNAKTRCPHSAKAVCAGILKRGAELAEPNDEQH